jgi:hypothetical protein
VLSDSLCYTESRNNYPSDGISYYLGENGLTICHNYSGNDMSFYTGHDSSCDDFGHMSYYIDDNKLISLDSAYYIEKIMYPTEEEKLKLQELSSSYQLSVSSSIAKQPLDDLE